MCVCVIINAKVCACVPDTSDGEHHRKYIRNHRLVAYTLLHNPCLRQLRASRLKEEVLAGETENFFALLT